VALPRKMIKMTATMVAVKIQQCSLWVLLSYTSLSTI